MKLSESPIEIFRREMLKLRADYLVHSLGQINVMKDLLQRRGEPCVSEDDMARLITAAHRLRGSGRTYDVPGMSDWAGLLEDDLKAIRANPDRMTPDRRRTLLSLIDQISSILQLEREGNQVATSELQE